MEPVDGVSAIGSHLWRTGNHQMRALACGAYSLHDEGKRGKNVAQADVGVLEIQTVTIGRAGRWGCQRAGWPERPQPSV